MAKDNFLKDNQSTIIWGVAIYFAYTKLLKPVLDTFGITKSDEEIKIEKEVIKIDSPWNPNYYLQFGSKPVTLIKETAIDGLLTTIWNSVGWNYDDYDAVLGVFKKLTTKTQVSQLVNRFNRKYKKDLLVWLRGDFWPSDRFSDAQVNQLIDLVKNYKNY
jgi:hypothetical protein